MRPIGDTTDSGRSTTRRARSGARATDGFDAWVAGDPAGLDDLVRLMTPVLWHVVRAYRLRRTPPRTSSRPPGWRWCAGAARSATPTPSAAG